MSNDVRQSFKSKNNPIADLVDLGVVGPKGSGTEVGKIWHKHVNKYIESPNQQNESLNQQNESPNQQNESPNQQNESPNQQNESPKQQNKNPYGEAVIQKLKSKGSIVAGIEFLQTEFPLYGYMADVQNSERCFWNGNADAIGWFEGNYVIVDWKAVDLLQFWNKNRHAYGDYLHQCIVYAKLFELHLLSTQVKKLPYILIVPINNTTGKEIQPALFRELPQACTGHISNYSWFTERPDSLINVKKEMITKDFRKKNSEELDNARVHEVFNDGITVRQLLDEFSLEFSKLKIKQEPPAEVVNNDN